MQNTLKLSPKQLLLSLQPSTQTRRPRAIMKLPSIVEEIRLFRDLSDWRTEIDRLQDVSSKTEETSKGSSGKSKGLVATRGGDGGWGCGWGGFDGGGTNGGCCGGGNNNWGGNSNGCSVRVDWGWGWSNYA